MVVTAWNNGAHHRSGAGYGFKVRREDRDRYFRRSWGTVLVELPGTTTPTEVNIDKDSFWGPTCRELISKEIGLWLRANGYAPWPSGQPPKFAVEPLGGRRFGLSRTL
jgi:hypothetical protein